MNTNLDQVDATVATAPSLTRPAFDITALVLGIMSILLFNAYFLCLPLGVLAIVFGVLGGRQSLGRGMALAGLITGIVGLSIGVMTLSVKALGLLIYFNF